MEGNQQGTDYIAFWNVRNSNYYQRNICWEGKETRTRPTQTVSGKHNMLVFDIEFKLIWIVKFIEGESQMALDRAKIEIKRILTEATLASMESDGGNRYSVL